MLLDYTYSSLPNSAVNSDLCVSSCDNEDTGVWDRFVNLEKSPKQTKHNTCAQGGQVFSLDQTADTTDRLVPKAKIRHSNEQWWSCTGINTRDGTGLPPLSSNKLAHQHSI